MQRLSLLMLFSLGLFGCGGGTPTDEASSDTSGESSVGASTTVSYDSPEAAYKAMRQAVEKKDWKTVASLMSPESQAMVAGMSILSSEFATMNDQGEQDEAKAKELKALLKKHGVDLGPADAEPTEEEMAAGPEAMMMSMTKSIPDVPVFIAEINAWMEKNSDQDGGAFAELGDLGEVTLDGKTAKAMSETEYGQQPIEFRKTGDSWIIHLPVGGPPEERVSEFDEPDDGTPGLGTFHLGDRSTKLRNAIAYRSKFFDEPCTVVLLTVRPLPDRMLDEIKGMLKAIEEDGSDEGIFPRGAHLKLSFDDQGKLISLFGWGEGMSINGNDGVDSEVTLKDNRVQGKITMSDAKEIFDTTYRFEAEFDAKMLSASDE